MKILYFTGTGNSLYVAKQFAAERISITQAMKNNEAVFEDDEIGIICPIYCHMPPKIVQEFLDKVTLSANYIFVIFTYGNRKCDAFEWMDEFMKSKGIDCSYIDAVKMVDNFLPSFDMNEQMSIDKEIDSQIKQVISSVKNHRTGYEKTTAKEIEHHQKVMEMTAATPESFDGSLLKVTDSCIGCGICSLVCPNGKYIMDGEKAVRKEGACEYCQACAQNCPQKAIIPGKTDKNPNARFRNPQISLQELVEANCIKTEKLL